MSRINLHTPRGFIRLGDIATVVRRYADPPTTMFRFNGEPAIGLAVAMSFDGDILRFGKAIQREIAVVEAGLPIGLDLHLVANQAEVVTTAVHGFMEALFEAIAIVLGVGFLALGVRAGLVVAVAIPIVLAITFTAMFVAGIALQRVSLGALIISLGLLVDDAMITVEMMIAKLEEGMDRVRAASFAYTTTAFPMLTGTMVTVVGFIPVGFARSDAGEYSSSLFWVIAIALLASWVVAILFSPLVGIYVLPKDREKRACRRAVHPIISSNPARLHASPLFGDRSYRRPVCDPSWLQASLMTSSFPPPTDRNWFFRSRCLKTRRCTRPSAPSRRLKSCWKTKLTSFTGPSIGARTRPFLFSPRTSSAEPVHRPGRDRDERRPHARAGPACLLP